MPDIMICAAAYALGVLVSSKVSLFYVLMYSVCMFIVGLIVNHFSKRKNSVLLIAIIVFAFGGVRYYQANSNRLYNALPDKYITLGGTVNSIPQKTDSGKYKYFLSAESAEYLGQTYKIRQEILLYLKEDVEYGDIISVKGFLDKLPEKMNQSDFDTAMYYKSKGRYNSLSADEMIKIGAKHSCSPVFLLGKLKSEIYKIIDANYTRDAGALLKAIIIGCKSDFSDDYYRLLLKTGMLRFLYAPFIHIYIIFFAIGLLSMLKKKVRDTLAVILLTMYALANSGSLIIAKAVIISLMLIAERRIFGYSSLLHTISAAVLVMLLINPLLCYNYGFVMSVVAALLLHLLYEPIEDKTKPLFEKLHIGRYLQRTLIVWVTITIGTLPLAAFYFNGISVYGIIFTLLAVPCIMIIILLSPILLAMLALFGRAPLIGDIVGFILYFIKNMPYVVHRLPGCYVMLKTPSILTIIDFYLSLWIFARWLKKRSDTGFTKILACALAGFIACGIMTYDFGALNIYFVNVGQGDGAVLHTARGETVLIDGGGAPVYKTYNVGEKIYVPYLIAHGFTDIDVAVVSHYHKDHVEGIIAAAENLKINTLIMPDSEKGGEYRTKLEEVARNKNIKIEYLRESDEIRFRSGMIMELLAPEEGMMKSNDLNTTSIVLHVKYGEFDALFTGDSPDNRISEYPKNVELLKVPHHGSKTSSSAEYVSWINPLFAVISVGKNNTYGLPKEEVLNRYRETGSQILRTDELGDIRFTVDKKNNIKYDSYMGVE